MFERGLGFSRAERAQLSAFLREHPGLEHYAGVLRGGTFVLVCDAQDVVVADFMLPYSCCEQREAPQPPRSSGTPIVTGPMFAQRLARFGGKPHYLFVAGEGGARRGGGAYPGSAPTAILEP